MSWMCWLYKLKIWKHPEKRTKQQPDNQKNTIQGDPKRCVPMKISIVTLIKKLFISNYNHTLFSLWKTIHQSFNYFCPFLVNLWLSQDVFQMSTISLQANL